MLRFHLPSFCSLQDPCEWKKGSNAREYTAGDNDDDDDEEEVLVKVKRNRKRDGGGDDIYNERDVDAY